MDRLPLFQRIEENQFEHWIGYLLELFWRLHTINNKPKSLKLKHFFVGGLADPQTLEQRVTFGVEELIGSSEKRYSIYVGMEVVQRDDLRQSTEEVPRLTGIEKDPKRIKTS